MPRTRKLIVTAILLFACLKSFSSASSIAIQPKSLEDIRVSTKQLASLRIPKAMPKNSLQVVLSVREEVAKHIRLFQWPGVSDESLKSLIGWDSNDQVIRRPETDKRKREYIFYVADNWRVSSLSKFSVEVLWISDPKLPKVVDRLNYEISGGKSRLLSFQRRVVRDCDSWPDCERPR